jgi:formate/nitrite transporter FocA (FNT family)
MEESKRRTADEIFEHAKSAAEDELARGSSNLAFSGLAGGLTMGFTGLGVALVRSFLGDGPSQQLISFLLYPVGFIAVIIGRQQLFTENTLYPVLLVLEHKRHIVDTLRLWTVVFLTNLVGAFLFALLCMKTEALRPEVRQAIAHLGTTAASRHFTDLFTSAIIAGWMIATVAWLVTASHWTSSQIMVTYFITFLMGMGHLAHCIAGSGEVFCAVLAGSVTSGGYLYWLVPATLGNIVGGVLLVSFFNWGQAGSKK